MGNREPATGNVSDPEVEAPTAGSGKLPVAGSRFPISHFRICYERPVRISAVAALSILLTFAPARAHAAGLDATVVLEATGYALPVGCSAVTGTYHTAYLLYGEGAPRGWRTAAYVCGGLSLGLGTYLLVTGDGSTDSTVVGVVPLVAGAFAIVTSLLVGAPDDIVGDVARAPRVSPWFGSGSAGLVWSGTF
jgi:hypothetical protein